MGVPILDGFDLIERMYCYIPKKTPRTTCSPFQSACTSIYGITNVYRTLFITNCRILVKISATSTSLGRQGRVVGAGAGVIFTTALTESGKTSILHNLGWRASEEPQNITLQYLSFLFHHAGSVDKQFYSQTSSQSGAVAAAHACCILLLSISPVFTSFQLEERRALQPSQEVSAIVSLIVEICNVCRFTFLSWAEACLLSICCGLFFSNK